MFNLTFVKQGANYEAEFSVRGNFNVHLEITQGSRCILYKKTTEDGEYSTERIIRNEMTSYDFDVTSDIATRWYLIRVAYPATGRITETTTPSEEGGSVEEIKKQVAEMLGNTPNSETAQTSAIDNQKEISDFLEGYTNQQKLKDVLNEQNQPLTDAQMQTLTDMFPTE